MTMTPFTPGGGDPTDILEGRRPRRPSSRDAPRPVTRVGERQGTGRLLPDGETNITEP
jgi:hypothetical protein